MFRECQAISELLINCSCSNLASVPSLSLDSIHVEHGALFAYKLDECYKMFIIDYFFTLME